MINIELSNSFIDMIIDKYAKMLKNDIVGIEILSATLLMFIILAIDGKYKVKEKDGVLSIIFDKKDVDSINYTGIDISDCYDDKYVINIENIVRKEVI